MRDRAVEPWPGDALGRLSSVNPEDVEAAVGLWRASVPAPMQDLLEAAHDAQGANAGGSATPDGLPSPPETAA